MKFEMTHKLAVATLTGSYPYASVSDFFTDLGLGHYDSWGLFRWYDGLESICKKYTIEELLCFAQMCIDSHEIY